MMETTNGLSDFIRCPKKASLKEKLNTSLRGVFWDTWYGSRYVEESIYEEENIDWN